MANVEDIIATAMRENNAALVRYLRANVESLTIEEINNVVLRARDTEQHLRLAIEKARTLRRINGQAEGD